MAEVKITVFNVLAAPWAKVSSYPPEAAVYLPREYRRQKVIELLQTQIPSTDVFCLQETTPTEFTFFQNHLFEYDGFQSNHDPTYWSRYIEEIPPWELNGTAIFIKRSSFGNITFSDLGNSNNGNHAAYVEATHLETGKKLGVASVHLDSDTGGNRTKEINAVIDHLKNRPLDVRVIAGDFNFSSGNGNFALDLRRVGYVDVLAAIGNNDRTHPDDKGYSNSQNFQIIDHIVVQNAVPVNGDVIDHNLFEVYPENTPAINSARITENLRLIGSDHFALWGLITI